MLFSKIYTALWACSSLVFASPLSPYSIAARDSSSNQGIFWSPRNIQRRNGQDRGKDIILAQPVGIQVSIIQVSLDAQLALLIAGQIVVEALEVVKDNIRKNHYRNRNRRNDVNTIIIIVTVVVDARDQRRQNQRFFTRQIEGNPGAAKQEWVVVTESKTMTVGNPNPTAVVDPSAVQAPVQPTGAVAPPVGVYDPNAPLQVGAGDALLPPGIVAPNYESRGARKDNDPAIIILAEQAVFVEFIDDNNDNNGRGRKNDNNDNNNDNDNDKGRGKDNRGD